MDAGDLACDCRQRRIDLCLEHIATFDDIDDMGLAVPVSEQPCTWLKLASLARSSPDAGSRRSEDIRYLRD